MLVNSIDTLASALNALRTSNKGYLAVDIETTGLRPLTDKIVSVQLATREAVYVIDMRGRKVGWMQSLIDAYTLVGHNLKFDLSFLQSSGLTLSQRIFDTQLAEQVIRGVGISDARKQGLSVSLEDTAARYGVHMSKAERSWFIDLDKREEWTKPFPEQQIRYMENDVTALFTVVDAQVKALRSLNLTSVAKLEFSVIPTLVEMELAGILIDIPAWRAFMVHKQAEADAAGDEALLALGVEVLKERYEVYTRERAAYDEYIDARTEVALGAEKGKKLQTVSAWKQLAMVVSKPRLSLDLVNIGSSAQVLTALHRLGAPLTSTDYAALEEIRDMYPVVSTLLAYRKAQKFCDAFGEALLQHVDVDGRIHSDYQQIGASTGRMSSRRPNSQQIPAKGDGQQLRKMVIARDGHMLITSDYSNIELRILADITGDATMLQLFAEGKDLHDETARMMFKLPNTISHAELKTLAAPSGMIYREAAKRINFGLVYGMGATKLAKDLGISPEESKGLYKAYFAVYPGVVKWLAARKAEVVKTWYSVTLSGRKRFYTKPLVPSNPGTCASHDALVRFETEKHEYHAQLAFIERQATNTPIQGTCADITKLACAYWFKARHQGARLIAVIHDEMVVEAPTGTADEVAHTLITCMHKAATHFLENVAMPTPDYVISRYWTKQ